MKTVIGVVIVLGILGGWLWLFIGGCEQPICRVLGVYTYRVDDLPEYVEYVAGADLYQIHHAAALAFSCEALRDQLATMLNEITISGAPLGKNNQLGDEVVRLGLLGVRREGKTLHMRNEVTVGSENLDVWASQMTTLLKSNPKDVRDNWFPAVMRRLFRSVVLHADDRTVEIPISPEFPCD